MARKELKTKPIDYSWQMFEKTGNISYYMLYNNLKNK